MTRTILRAVSLSAAVAHAGPTQEAKKHVDRAMKATRRASTPSR